MCFSVAPWTKLDDAKRQALAAAAQLNLTVTTSCIEGADNAILPGLDSLDRLVGAQDITVVMQAQGSSPLGTVLHMFEGLNAKVCGMNNILERQTAKQLREVSAEVLNRALDGDLRSSACTRFAALSTNNNKIQHLSALSGKPEKEIIFLADSLITQRNNQAHVSSAAALAHAVEECLEHVEDMPSLKTRCPSEFWVLSNYSHIVTAFSPQLDP